MAKLTTTTLDEKNRAIACPTKLKTQDGREIYITEWRPCVCFDPAVSVEIKGIIINKQEVES